MKSGSALNGAGVCLAMKATLLIHCSLLFSLTTGLAQGVFEGSNGSQQTRVGSIDGTLAGTNIFGQFLAGPTADSLAPVGYAQPHFAQGYFGPGETTVPNVSPFSYAQVQLVAWDAALWGAVFENVPSDQFGRTDIVQVLLTRGSIPWGDPVIAPHFTQPAIVPIPEPSVWALLVLGTTGLWLARCRRE